MTVSTREINEVFRSQCCRLCTNKIISPPLFSPPPLKVDYFSVWVKQGPFKNLQKTSACFKSNLDSRDARAVSACFGGAILHRSNTAKANFGLDKDTSLRFNSKVLLQSLNSLIRWIWNSNLYWFFLAWNKYLTRVWLNHLVPNCH